MGVNVCPNSADFIQFDPFAKLGNSLSTRSAHYLDNRVGHVPLEEAGSCIGEPLKEILRQPFGVTVAGPWVEGGDSRG